MSATIICLGDSITFGYPWGPESSWVSHLQRSTGANLVNSGINGDTTLEMLRRFERIVSHAKVTHVHILGGANDAWQGLDIASAKQNIKKIVELSGRRGIIPVLGLATPLCKEPVQGGTFIPFGFEAMESWLAGYREWMRDYAGDNGITLIDYFTPLCMPGTGRGNSQFFYDECHLNQNGYAFMAEVAKDTLVDWL